MTINRRVKVRLTGAALATQGNEQPAAVEGAVPREDTEMTTRFRAWLTRKDQLPVFDMDEIPILAVDSPTDPSHLNEVLASWISDRTRPLVLGPGIRIVGKARVPLVRSVSNCDEAFQREMKMMGRSIRR